MTRVGSQRHRKKKVDQVLDTSVLCLYTEMKSIICKYIYKSTIRIAMPILRMSSLHYGICVALFI